MDRDQRDTKTFAAQFVVSLIFIGLGITIVLGDYDDELQKAAWGWLGIVLGYWLSVRT